MVADPPAKPQDTKPGKQEGAPAPKEQRPFLSPLRKPPAPRPPPSAAGRGPAEVAVRPPGAAKSGPPPPPPPGRRPAAKAAAAKDEESQRPDSGRREPGPPASLFPAYGYAPAPAHQPFAFPVPSAPVTYSPGPSSTFGVKTEAGVRVLMYSFLVGALTSVALVFPGFAQSTGASNAAFCFGAALGALSLVMGLVGAVRLHADREAFGGTHARHVRLALGLYVVGFLGLAATWVIDVGSFPTPREAVTTPGFTFSTLVPVRATVALFGVLFGALVVAAAFYLLRGLQTPLGLGVLQVAVVVALLVRAAVSFGELLVFAAAVPLLDAGVAAGSQNHIEAVIDQYNREVGMLGLAAVSANVLFAYATWIVMQHLPRLKEAHAPKGEVPAVAVFYPYGPPPMVYPPGAFAPPPAGYGPRPGPAAPLVFVPVACPRCGRPAEFIAEYSRYFCRACSEYV